MVQSAVNQERTAIAQLGKNQIATVERLHKAFRVGGATDPHDEYVRGICEACSSLQKEMTERTPGPGRFTCPVCFGHTFGSLEQQDGSLTRHCHGFDITATPPNLCAFTWPQRDDALYGMRPHPPDTDVAREGTP